MDKSTEVRFTKSELLTNYWNLVNKSISQFGDKDFIVTKNGTVTFSEAISRAEGIRNRITQLTKKNQIGVGIFLQDPREVIPCMIGVVRAGNYFMVMDVSFPGLNLLHMINDAKVQIILTTNQYISVIQSLVDESIDVINIDLIPKDQVEEILPIEYSPEDIVQIMFTSGSTGKPKGAIEDYRYLMRAVRVKMETYDFKRDDKILQLSTFTYSGHHTFVFTALVIGLTICYHPVKVEGFANLPSWIKEKEITIFTSTPTTFRSLVSVLKPKDTFPLIHTCYLGGEKRLRNDILAIKKYFPNVKWVRVNYSGTEMQTVASALVPINTALELDLIPSGYPCDDLKVYIWDRAGNELPQGNEGEIVIHGDGLARGYINNPELTNKRFIKDSQNPNWQYLKTGDLGKILDDGQLMHLGRIDNMVKIKGVRIELDSIEDRISSYPGVIHVTSKVFEDEKGIKRLATYYTVEEGIHIPVSDLRKHLAQVLPLQHIPSFFICLDKLPSTPTGKVDFDSLPIPSITRPDLEIPYSSPETETERNLVLIWEEQIGVSGIGVLDNFFDVGGDSLIGMLIFSEIEKVFGISIPVSSLLLAPTIRELAKILDGDTTVKLHSPIMAINPQGSKSPVFFIPGKGGYPTRIRHLSQRIYPDFPLYAFQNPIDVNGASTYKDIEQIASVFQKLILEISPNGNCSLIGESLGGKIAYEIGQQITKKGLQTPLIFLLDTYNDQGTKPGYYKRGGKFQYYQMIVKKHASIWFRSSWKGKIEYLRFYRETFKNSLVKKFYRIKRKLTDSLYRKNQVTDRGIEKNLLEISSKYLIKPYSGKVVLIVAARGSRDGSVAHGWDKVGISELLIERLDCFHGSMLFEPAVSELAKIIQMHLSDN